MSRKECKRLAEVDFPIAVVSKHAAREKLIRHGHPSTLHIWWARRPLAACRAMLLGLLLPDPCHPDCPTEFKSTARKVLEELLGIQEGDEGLRRALITFVGDVANWDVANHRRWIGVARELVKAAHGDDIPLVVDSFAGGGSIPLEALRLGCETFASDLNPVACFILKTILQDIPRQGTELAEELRRVGTAIKKVAAEQLAEFYPADPGGARPIAYLWARTVRCEAPNCGAEIPLARSFWLCRKANRKRALRWQILRAKGGRPQVEFEVFEPRTEAEIPSGTLTRARAMCPSCGSVLAPERVRAQLAAQRGGGDVVFNTKGRRTGGARMLAVVTLKPGEQGRHYRLPAERDYEAVRKAQERLAAILREWERGGKQGLCPVPDEPTPAGGGSGAGRAFSVQRYGMLQWGDLFTARQKVALLTLGQNARQIEASPLDLLACVLAKLADKQSTLCGWKTTAEYMGTHTFSRQALPIVWDFCEANPLGEESGSISQELGWVSEVAALQGDSLLVPGSSQMSDACASPLPDNVATIWFTDPPYYDAVPYADLSDFFFVWLKRLLPSHPLLRDLFDPLNPLTPKIREIVQDETKQVNGRPKDREFFEEAMAKAFREGRRVLRDDGVGCVVFAHKTTEGWEALLSGMIRGGWIITGSWPIATEMGSRLRARESAALATSVHLVCRPRSGNADIGDWGEVLNELPIRVGDWMERLQLEGIRGADLVFACIGPALEIFSRYSKVETAEGREIQLAEYLEKVWEVVGRTALEQVLGTAEAMARNSAAGILEEDARLTALFLWTIQGANGGKVNGAAEEPDGETDEDEEAEASQIKKLGFSLIFDVVRRFAQPLGIHLPDWEGRIIETKKGVVRLLSVAERAKQLFGEEGAQAVADRLERTPTSTLQLALFSEAIDKSSTEIKRRGRTRRTKGSANISDKALRTRRESTTLDRVHAAMLLQAGGRASALRALLRAEQDRGPNFLRLANALSALYPKQSEEKRVLDAMLLAAPRN